MMIDDNNQYVLIFEREDKEEFIAIDTLNMCFGYAYNFFVGMMTTSGCTGTMAEAYYHESDTNPYYDIPCVWADSETDKQYGGVFKVIRNETNHVYRAVRKQRTTTDEVESFG